MGKTYKIAVMGGDGTGPEVAAEGLKVLQVAAAKFDFNLELTDSRPQCEQEFVVSDFLACRSAQRLCVAIDGRDGCIEMQLYLRLFVKTRRLDVEALGR